MRRAKTVDVQESSFMEVSLAFRAASSASLKRSKSGVQGRYFQFARKGCHRKREESSTAQRPDE